MALTKYKLGELISPCDERNYEGTYTLDDIKGISTGKEFIDTKANMDGVSLSSYKVVNCQEFAYVADTSRRGEKIAIAFNNSEKAVLISSIYTVFRVSKTYLLNSDYLFMYFNRPEFDRYARYNSWGSATSPTVLCVSFGDGEVLPVAAGTCPGRPSENCCSMKFCRRI